MLPFDNKSEFQVIVDMPEGTTLEAHDRGRARDRRLPDHRARGDRLPGLRRHRGAGELQRPGAALLPAARRRTWPTSRSTWPEKSERKDAEPRRSPRACAGRSRRSPQRHGAAIKVVEVPPGPPVLSTLVAEVYGPDLAEGRLEMARQVKEVFETTPGVVDVDWFVEADQTRYRFVVDKERAAVRGRQHRARSPRPWRWPSAATRPASLHVDRRRGAGAAGRPPAAGRPQRARGSLQNLYVWLASPAALVPLADVVTDRDLAAARRACTGAT